jgi:hypothetical protein
MEWIVVLAPSSFEFYFLRFALCEYRVVTVVHSASLTKSRWLVESPVETVSAMLGWEGHCPWGMIKFLGKKKKKKVERR